MFHHRSGFRLDGQLCSKDIHDQYLHFIGISVINHRNARHYSKTYKGTTRQGSWPKWILIRVKCLPQLNIDFRWPCLGGAVGVAQASDLPYWLTWRERLQATIKVPQTAPVWTQIVLTELAQSDEHPISIWFMRRSRKRKSICVDHIREEDGCPGCEETVCGRRLSVGALLPTPPPQPPCF